MENQKTTYKKRLTKITTTTEEQEELMILETEKVPGYDDVKLPRKSKLNNGNFITVFQDNLYDIANKGDLSKPELLLLVYFLSRANMDGSIILDLDYLVAETHLQKSNISTALSNLVKRNIIHKKCFEQGDRKKGNHSMYELSLQKDRISYNLAWRGKVSHYKEVKGKDKILTNNLLQAPLNPPKTLDMYEQAEKDIAQKAIISNKIVYVPLHKLML